MITLGIESSCDETGVGIFSSADGLLAAQTFSQAAMHADYGGVVPEVAARAHIEKIAPLIDLALQDANLDFENLGAVAYTQGPGLAGALLVGAAVAKSFAWGRRLPCLGVHHMEGHILSPFLENEKPNFPFLALLVSGGHTMLVEARTVGDYKILGESLDDAVGEAFDKTAKILSLGYPGGAALEKLARQGTPEHFVFPQPMIKKPGLDFSFSGLKTHARNIYADFPAERANIALAFEHAAVGVLVAKSRRALIQTGHHHFVVAGGVGANQYLREKLTKMARALDVEIFYPRMDFCTDNGAMIALAGNLRLNAGEADRDDKIVVRPRWGLEELQPLGKSAKIFG